MVTARDVSDQVALRQQVAHLTFHDGLTGLPNRAYIEERTRDLLRDATTARRVGVIFLDLDRFTAVNDSVGHGAGDLVLAQAPGACAPPSRSTTRCALGSDEFAVLVENAGGVPELSEIAERLVGVVAAEPFRVAGQQIALTASVGVALAGREPQSPGPPDYPDDPAGLVLRNADVAMSRAREACGDRAEVYAAHMHADVVPQARDRDRPAAPSATASSPCSTSQSWSWPPRASSAPRRWSAGGAGARSSPRASSSAPPRNRA